MKERKLVFYSTSFTTATISHPLMWSPNPCFTP